MVRVCLSLSFFFSFAFCLHLCVRLWWNAKNQIKWTENDEYETDRTKRARTPPIMSSQLLAALIHQRLTHLKLMMASSYHISSKNIQRVPCNSIQQWLILLLNIDCILCLYIWNMHNTHTHIFNAMSPTKTEHTIFLWL